MVIIIMKFWSIFPSSYFVCCYNKQNKTISSIATRYRVEIEEIVLCYPDWLLSLLFIFGKFFSFIFVVFLYLKTQIIFDINTLMVHQVSFRERKIEYVFQKNA